MDVDGYVGLYQVSNMGRIKSLINNFGVKRDLVLKELLTVNGYQCICLCKCKIKKTLTIHRLVATAFIPKPENKDWINHINGVKADNRVENLEWCTPRENSMHSLNVLKNKHGKSKKIAQFSLKNEHISDYESSDVASKNLSIQRTNIVACLKGRRGACGGFKWKYVEY